MTWLPFYEAAKEIEHKLEVSAGKAQSILRQLCASGEARSQKEPYVIVGHEPEWQGPPERIEPSEWCHHEIDLMTDDNGCRYLVDVDEADFRYWLDHQRIDHQQKGKPQRGKQLLVIKYLTEKFSGQTVPDPALCQRKGLLAELRQCDRNLASLDPKTLNSAIKKYNLSSTVDGKRS